MFFQRAPYEKDFHLKLSPNISAFPLILRKRTAILPFRHHSRVHEAGRGQDAAEGPDDEQEEARLLPGRPMPQWVHDGNIAAKKREQHKPRL